MELSLTEDRLDRELVVSPMFLPDGLTVASTCFRVGPLPNIGQKGDFVSVHSREKWQ